LDEAGHVALERPEVEGDDRAVADLGEALDEPVADLAARSGDQHNRLAEHATSRDALVLTGDWAGGKGRPPPCSRTGSAPVSRGRWKGSCGSARASAPTCSRSRGSPSTVLRARSSAARGARDTRAPGSCARAGSWPSWRASST